MRAAADRFGDRTAYIAQRVGLPWADGLSITYRDLDRVSDEVAAGLSRLGIGPANRVALVLPPGPEYLLAYLAIAKLGAVTAGVNDRLTVEERSAVIGRCDPALVLAAPGLETDIAPCITIPRADALTTVLGPVRVDERPPTPTLPHDRDVAIVFTSGTTGVPKGARYGTRQLACITTTDIGDAWDLGGRTFTGTSFAHLGFMTKLPGNLRRGGVNFIMERWRADDALELLADQRMTTVAGVPTQIALMLRRPDFERHDLSSVQYIVVGGGPVTPGLAEEARRRFGAKLQTRYSCTEAGIGLGTGFDDPEEDAVVSVGRPHPVVTLAIRNADDPADPSDRAIGEIGEVCLRSDACMHGYWDDAEATRAAFTADGFVRTGDLGYVDDRGRVRLVGRSKEMYVRGGYNVYPVEVEAVLSQHPAVAAVALVPRPDPVMGEIGVAVVVTRAGSPRPTLATLREFAASSVAPYKLPEAIHFVDALPLTAMEKLDRRALAVEVTATGPDR